MGLMESMSSGVPVVSTPVGMAPDLIQDNINGRLSPDVDAEQIASLALDLLSSPNLHQYTLHARQSVMIADWKQVATDHWSKVYLPLLEL